MNTLARALLLAAVAALSLSCAAVDDEELELASHEAALDNVGPSLGSGKYTFLATVTGAENQVFAGGRLFITGDKGIYELRKNGANYDRITVAPEQKSPFCQFGGITEVRGTLYVNCYGVTQSFIFAATLAPTPSFRAIYTLDGNGFANGLSSDDAGRLYVATTFQDQILRLIPSSTNPFVIATREVYQKKSGTLTNGLAHHAGSIYWTDTAVIKRNTVDREFATFKQVVVDAAYFDDLHVDESGILAADAVGGVLRAYSLAGKATGVTKQKFSGPSSVGRALGQAGFSQNALIVTERNGNKVSLFEPGL